MISSLARLNISIRLKFTRTYLNEIEAFEHLLYCQEFNLIIENIFHFKVFFEVLENWKSKLPSLANLEEVMLLRLYCMSRNVHKFQSSIEQIFVELFIVDTGLSSDEESFELIISLHAARSKARLVTLRRSKCLVE